MPSHSSHTSSLPSDHRDLLEALQEMEEAIQHFKEFLPAELILPRRPAQYEQALEAGFAAYGRAATVLDTYRSRLIYERDRWEAARQQFAPSTQPTIHTPAIDPFNRGTI